MVGDAWEPTPEPARPPDKADPSKPSPNQRTIPEFVPFPVDALPTAIRPYVLEASEAMGCDASYIALPVLAVAAGLVGTARYIRLKRVWKEPAVIWAAVVGEPSSIKSPAFNLVRWPLLDVQERLDGDFIRKLNQFTEDLADWKEADESSRGEKPVAPLKHEVFVSDCTIERLGEILQANPRGTLLARDELAAWFNSFCRYKGKNGGSDLQNWLELWQAGTLKIHRKVAIPRDLYVKKAVCSVAGTIQPGVLTRALSSDLFDSGAPFRLLFAMPPRRLKEWRELDLSEEAESIWKNVVERLGALESEWVLSMTPEAKALWVEFYNRGGKKQFDAHGPMQAALGKIEAYGARLALVHYLIECAARGDDPARGPITAENMEAGIKLANWFANEAERVYLMLNESEEARELRYLSEKIQGKGGRITPRDLQRSNGKRYPTAEDAEAALEKLVQAGYGIWQEGSPKTFLLLRPTSDKSDTWTH